MLDAPSPCRSLFVARARLMLQRQLRRAWFRAVAADGHLGDLMVTLDEARITLLQESTPPPLPLPEVEALTAAIAENRSAAKALPASAAAPVRVLHRLGVSGELVELILVGAALQSEPSLLRAATRVWGDFTRQQPSLGFLIELCADDPSHRERLERELGPDWPARRLRLVELGDDRRWHPAPPPLARPVLIPASVERLLAGRPPFDDRAPAGAFAVEAEGPASQGLILAERDRLERALSALATGRDPTPVLLVGPRGSGRRSLVRAQALAAGQVLFRIELSALDADPRRFEEQLAGLLRDGRLAGGLILLRADELEPAEHRAVVVRLARAMRPPVVLTLAEPEAPRWISALPEARVLSLDPPDAETRRSLYARLLVQHAFDLSRPQVARLVDTYRLQPGELDRALRDVRSDAADSPQLDRRAFDRAVRRRIRGRLADLATPITTGQTWADLVVDDEQRATIDEIIAHARHRTEVFEGWGFSARVGGRGRGLACLFSGPPGTGKTMTATLIAQALDLELFLVDLSRVVDKYVGETEKNLARLFDEAEQAPVVLLFDEADSLFATRTRVESSNDRYANLEVNFLLQRMERFEGISILTTNRETAIDPAFKRRLRFRLHFGLPDEEQRLRLWRSMVPPGCPIDPDIDWGGLAAQWEMSGALIRNAMLRAAFLAAARDRPLDEASIRQATRTELVEMGRLGS